MTDTPKPPMVVWVHERHTEIATLVKPNKIMDAFSVGPYVHLDQLLAEVERRANSGNDTGYWRKTYAGLQAIAQELKQ